MQLGVHFIDFLPDCPERLGPTLAASAKAAEDGGAAWFTLADHFFHSDTVGQTVYDPFLEGYTSLGYLAGQTSRVALGMAVTGVTYRYPGVLAKVAATLDVLTQGRSIFGIGAAWYEREHTGLGVPYPPLRERFEMLEETLQICRQMWSDDDGPYRGRHYQLDETICAPQPIRRPPILIGGDGERKTLRLVAQYADVWNSTARNATDFGHKAEVLNRHCEAVGRDPAEIQKTVMMRPDADPFSADFERTAAGFAAQGVDLLLLAVLPQVSDPVGWISRLCETAVPVLAELGRPPGAPVF